MTTLLKTVSEVQAFRRLHADKKLGFVPTMGNLHAGHLSLIDIARQQSDIVIVSIFVNPTQFGPNEDLDAYPRTFDADLAQLQSKGVAAVFFPDDSSIYPYGQDNTLCIELPHSLMGILCGVDRPTHFQGVATVVAKLFQIVHPDVAVFGKKDFQQLAIIRRLNKELFMNIRIVGAEIVREANGLAMSSRNQYLSDTERELAANLSKTLQKCRERLLDGETAEMVLGQAKQHLTDVGFQVEYLELRHRETLRELPEAQEGVLLLAARLGKTRLIDNLSIY